MRGNINFNRVVMDVVMLLPITTLFQGIIPIINRILFFVLILSLAFIAFKKKKTTYEISILMLFSISYVAAFIFTEGPLDNENDIFYLLFFILFSDYVISGYEFIKRYLKSNYNYLKGIVIAWDFFVFISIFLKSSYEDGYFFSFTGNVFRSATAATFILGIAMILITKKRINIIYAIIPMFCIFSGGSRTYLAVGLAICVAMYYIITPSRRFFLVSLIPIAVVFLAIILNSSIMDKIDSSLTVSSTEYYQDPLVKFTSGRSLFWLADIRAFFSGNIINQILGYGYRFVYDINNKAIHNRIWAHNDYINILLCYGYIGLASYLLMFRLMFKKCVSNLKLPRFIKIIAILIWFFNAFFNMFYTYVCASASYPFILFGISLFWENKIEKEKYGWKQK